MIFTIQQMKTFLLLLCLSNSLVASPIPDFPFIYVKGKAHENIPTNLAIIRFEVDKNHRVSEEGETALSDANKAIRKELLALGVKEKDISATEIQKSEEYGEFPQFRKKVQSDISILPLPVPLDEEEPEQKVKKEAYYSFTQQYVIQLTDLKLYSQIVRSLMRSDHVSQYRVHFSATNRKDVVQKLRKEAFADAKRAAQELADASGETLGRLHSVSEMPHSDLSDLIGGDDSDSMLYAGSAVSVPIYEVPATVTEYFDVIALFRIEQNITAAEKEDDTPTPATTPAPK
jgi:uncharacterized protein YggE